MGKRRYAEHRRFLALRACLMILRDKSVAWNIDVSDGGFGSRTDDMFVVGCTINGKPVGAANLSFDDPEPQPE